MNLSSGLFVASWHVFAGLLSLLALGWGLWRAPWRALGIAGRSHAVLGATVVLMVLWSMKATVTPDFSLHLLGAMAVTLSFGPHLALLVLAGALCAITLNGALSWSAWPANFVLMALVPVLFASAYRAVIEQRLPRHFFVFIFLIAFLGSGLTVFVQGVSSAALLYLSGSFPGYFLAEEVLPYYLLLGFAEAWLSGALITLLVVYRPEWVYSFSDRRYLQS